MYGTYVYYHTYRGKKKTSNDKNHVFKEKNNYKKNSIYFSEFSNFVVLNSNSSLYINFLY